MIADTEYVRVPVDAFRPSFSAMTHMFLTILAYCKPSSLLVLWNKHHDMSITDIHYSLTRYRELFSGDSDALAYALLKARGYYQAWSWPPFHV